MPENYLIDIRQKFGSEAIPLSRGDLSLKIDSVRYFLNFLELEEDEEISPVRKQLDSY